MLGAVELGRIGAPVVGAVVVGLIPTDGAPTAVLVVVAGGSVAMFWAAETPVVAGAVVTPDEDAAVGVALDISSSVLALLAPPQSAASVSNGWFPFMVDDSVFVYSYVCLCQAASVHKSLPLFIFLIHTCWRRDSGWPQVPLLLVLLFVFPSCWCRLCLWLPAWIPFTVVLSIATYTDKNTNTNTHTDTRAPSSPVLHSVSVLCFAFRLSISIPLTLDA